MSAASSVAPQLRAQLLRALFTPDLPNTSPGAVAMGLTTQVVNASQPSTWLPYEVQAPDYSRVVLPLNSQTWTLSGVDTMLNVAVISFPAPVTDWGLVAGWVMIANDGSSTLYAAGPLQSTTVASGATAPAIPALGLGVRLFD